MKPIFFKNIKFILSGFIHKKLDINYLFFLIFFISVSFFSISGTSIFFSVYAIFQTGFLTLILIFLENKIRYNFLKKIFTASIFILLLAYLINFILVGLINTSLMFTFNIFFSGGFENFFITLRAINLNIVIIFILLGSFILLPLIGILLYRYTHITSKKYSLTITNRHLLISILFLFLSLIVLDLHANKTSNSSLFDNQKRLPLGSNFITYKKEYVSFDQFIPNIKDEATLLNEFKKENIRLEKKPNIFIFVVEALRKDFITKDITPNIYDFSKENITFEKSYSSSNNTHTSWYSIFHSNYPIYWTKSLKNYPSGSLPLNILKKLGYEISVYTSAEMSYFKMDKILFGQKNLADNFFDFSSVSSDPAKRDLKSINTLCKNLKNTKNEGHVFLIFLDSTHSEYSWDKSFKPKFTPYANKINYVALSQSKKTLPLVINSYKNAISYIDYLFDKVNSSLKSNNLYDDSLIIFTADHGEEFFENGALFHGSNLNKYQISVPIIYKMINLTSSGTKISSHIDIFPTILHHLTGFEFQKYFHGRSIFSNDLKNFSISVNQKGAITPNELLINFDNFSFHAFLISNSNKTVFEIIEKKGDENYQNKIAEALDF